jgi:hypothetical protein
MGPLKAWTPEDEGLTSMIVAGRRPAEIAVEVAKFTRGFDRTTHLIFPRKAISTRRPIVPQRLDVRKRICPELGMDCLLRRESAQEPNRDGEQGQTSP